MTHEQFVQFVIEHQERARAILKEKDLDYAGRESDSAFANFYEEARNLDLKPEQIWHVWASKHWSAITTYCREGDTHSEPIEGRIHDIINYSFLLLGLIEERKAADDPQPGARVVGAGATSTPPHPRSPNPYDILCRYKGLHVTDAVRQQVQSAIDRLGYTGQVVIDGDELRYVEAFSGQHDIGPIE